jgi:hypothetical protein
MRKNANTSEKLVIVEVRESYPHKPDREGSLLRAYITATTLLLARLAEIQTTAMGWARPTAWSTAPRFASHVPKHLLL